jgi:hypothetical protein
MSVEYYQPYDGAYDAKFEYPAHGKVTVKTEINLSVGRAQSQFTKENLI